MRRSIRQHAACSSIAAVLAGGAWAAPPHPAVLAGKAGADLGPALVQGLDRPAPRRARLPDRVLVLLVDFADRPHAANLTQAALDSLFFGGAGSLRDFYLRSSFGRLDVAGTVTPWLRLPQTYAFYADAERGGRGVLGAYPRNARRMVEDAVRAAAAHVDFAAFDNDGPDGAAASGDDDGIVDALVVVHAGDGAEEGDRRDILSHTWFTTAAVPTRAGVSAWLYATVAETSPLGVRAHEFGHLLGLADLYDRRSTTALAGGLGAWSLMAGAGPWLDGGRTPADLDAASKIELGFVDAAVPAANAAGRLLRAAGAGAPGDVYRIWTHGRPQTEFFIVENRQPRLQDAHLPGGGMLVYHVDLLQAHNDDPYFPRVQLLQADGQEHIERRINNGDAGDPFPGARGVARLDATTAPGTRARDGSDTQIALSGITAGTGTMRFDLQIETRPRIVVATHAWRELEGDGDGTPEAGERLQLDAVVVNQGQQAAPFTVTARAEPEADAAWDLHRADVPGLAKGDSARVRFQLRPRADLGDPYGLALVATLHGDAWSDELVWVAALGARTGFQACLGAVPSRFTRDCSDPEAPWSVRVLRGTGTWRREVRAGDLGGVYRSAAGARYANGSDVALESPPFNLAPGSVLRLLHAWDTEVLAGVWAQDGGRVEIAVDGGAWEAIAPRRGYPYRLWFESVPHLAQAGVFAGRSERRWDVFELGARGGSARLRFRFASDDSIGAAGWELARVEVGPEPPAPQASLALVAEPNPVRLPAQMAFRIDASLTAPARATTLRIHDVRGRLVRTLVHAPVPAGSARFLWDGTDRAGQPVASGTYFARLEWGGNAATVKLQIVR